MSRRIRIPLHKKRRSVPAYYTAQSPPPHYDDLFGPNANSGLRKLNYTMMCNWES